MEILESVGSRKIACLATLGGQKVSSIVRFFSHKSFKLAETATKQDGKMSQLVQKASSVKKEEQLSSEQLMATLIKSYFIGEKKPTVKELAGKLAEGARNGLKTGSLDIRRVPDGYYSENLDEFVGAMTAFQFATKRSPLDLTSEGQAFLKDLIIKASDQHPVELEKWLKFLGVDKERMVR